VLQGIKLHLGWKTAGGAIPVSALLANPFSCAIGIRDVNLRVYAEPELREPIGWVTMLSSDQQFEALGIPLLMPPGFNMNVNGTIFPMKFNIQLPVRSRSAMKRPSRF
jgi:hypothetical protein